MTPYFPPSIVAVGSALCNPCHVLCLCTHDKLLSLIYVESGSPSWHPRLYNNTSHHGACSQPSVTSWCVCFEQAEAYWEMKKNIDGLLSSTLSASLSEEELVLRPSSSLSKIVATLVHHRQAQASRKVRPSVFSQCPIQLCPMPDATRLKTWNDLLKPLQSHDLYFHVGTANVTICLRVQQQVVSVIGNASTGSCSSPELCHSNECLSKHISVPNTSAAAWHLRRSMVQPVWHCQANHLLLSTNTSC
jgi:hypothetical protein